MEAEAQPLLERLGLEKDNPPPIAAPAPAVSYSGKALGLDLHIVCNGEHVAMCSEMLYCCRVQVDMSLQSAETVLFMVEFIGGLVQCILCCAEIG